MAGNVDLMDQPFSMQPQRRPPGLFNRPPEAGQPNAGTPGAQSIPPNPGAPSGFFRGGGPAPVAPPASPAPMRPPQAGFGLGFDRRPPTPDSPAGAGMPTAGNPAAAGLFKSAPLAPFDRMQPNPNVEAGGAATAPAPPLSVSGGGAQTTVPAGGGAPPAPAGPSFVNPVAPPAPLLGGTGQPTMQLLNDQQAQGDLLPPALAGGTGVPGAGPMLPGAAGRPQGFFRGNRMAMMV